MNTYIILAAGVGNNLQPLTLKHPKASYKLDENTSVIQRMIRGIRHFDETAEVVVVCGYLATSLKEELLSDNVKFVVNPFYAVTNSISSLWFAREYLERENVTILAGDIVAEDSLICGLITKPTDKPFVLLDSSPCPQGFYSAVVDEKKVLVMSKKLEKWDARYCGITKLDAVSSRLVKNEIDDMVHGNMYDQFFEDSLIQLVMFQNFDLFFEDIKGSRWVEINSVNDLLAAKAIHKDSFLNR